MTPIDILKTGKERIEQGWCKRKFEVTIRGGTSYCAVGSMMSFMEEYPMEYAIAVKRLSDKVPGYIPITTYNDDVMTTHDDMIELFDKAIRSSNVLPSDDNRTTQVSG